MGNALNSGVNYFKTNYCTQCQTCGPSASMSTCTTGGFCNSFIPIVISLSNTAANIPMSMGRVQLCHNSSNVQIPLVVLSYNPNDVGTVKMGPTSPSADPNQLVSSWPTDVTCPLPLTIGGASTIESFGSWVTKAVAVTNAPVLPLPSGAAHYVQLVATQVVDADTLKEVRLLGRASCSIAGITPSPACTLTLSNFNNSKSVSVDVGAFVVHSTQVVSITAAMISAIL